MPVGSGASFVSAGGQNFYALCTVAANNSADTAYNWGFTLVPQGALTTEATVGWGPGSADGTVNGSPIWVTTLANTTVAIRYVAAEPVPSAPPVYATPFTARLIAGKLEEAGLQERVRVNAVPLHGKLKLGPFDIEFISITHSIPEPNVLAIRTPLGVVVHTGDWKLDPDPLVGEATDSNALQKLGDAGVLATVCDSTNALVSGQSGSELTVRKALTDLIGTLKGRVAVTSFASNVARLDTIAKAARAHGREIVLVGRAMHKIVAAARDTGYLADFPNVLDEEEAADLPPRRVLYLCTGSQGEVARRAVAHRGRRESECPARAGRYGDFFLAHHSRQRSANSSRCTTSWPGSASKSFPRTIILSMSPAIRRATNWLRCIAGRGPRIAVPVHGELRHMTAHARLARSLQVPRRW